MEGNYPRLESAHVITKLLFFRAVLVKRETSVITLFTPTLKHSQLCAGVYIVRVATQFHPLSVFGVRNFLVLLPSPFSVTVFWLNRFLNRLGGLTLCVVFNVAITSSKFRLAGASKLLSRPAGMVTHQCPCMTITKVFVFFDGDEVLQDGMGGI
jgi:hypothetical protein